VQDPEHHNEYLDRRRSESRRRVRRQRLGAGVAVLGAAIAVVAAVAAGSGGSGADKTQPASTARRPTLRRAAKQPAVPQKFPASSTGSHNRRIPILMYHAVEAPPPGAALPDLWVSKDRFESELAMLYSQGYQGVSLRNVYDYWKGHGGLPRKPVVISFDDGFRSHYTVAMPALRRLRWPGVLNLEIGALKGSGPEHITSGEVHALVRAGWEIDAHTIDHLDLTQIPPERQRYEVAEGRRQIKQRFGVPVEFFCYPAGRYNAAVVDQVKRAGFLAATTTVPGLGSPSELFTLKRIRVGANDSAALLSKTLAEAG
jgi:peptidoglycan/xylan/chitin deacetylase (PgdA/CDA1 family)